MITENMLYVQYFWKYATKEQIEDMMFLSIFMISEYILELGKQYYHMHTNSEWIFKNISDKLWIINYKL